MSTISKSIEYDVIKIQSRIRPFETLVSKNEMGRLPLTFNIWLKKHSLKQ